MLQFLRRQLNSRSSLPIAQTIAPNHIYPRTHHAPFSNSTSRSSFWSDLTSSFKSLPKSNFKVEGKPIQAPLTSKSSSQTTNPNPSNSTNTIKTTSASPTFLPPKATKHKTIAEADAELLAKLEKISGEGGASGVEYEGGKAVGLKRGVKDNMFRVI